MHDNDAIERAQRMNEFFEPLVPGLLGIVCDYAGSDRVVAHIDVVPKLIAGTGFLFAPAVIALADGCAAIGCGANIPEGASFTTIELKTNFMSSARVGEPVVCTCTPVHLGRQTHVWDAVGRERDDGSHDGVVPLHADGAEPKAVATAFWQAAPMLQMKPGCENCDVDLPADQPGALICSFECTWCANCAEPLGGTCPNCGGALVARPTRATALLENFPAATERTHKPR